MKLVTIGKDHFLNRDIKKIHYSKEELPDVQLFSSSDVIMGNPNSNLAVGIVYTWQSDRPPKEIQEIVQKISTYASMTGFWRTTNGARYVFKNILSNPNINKLIMISFDFKDNGHLLIDALINYWLNGVNNNGIIIGSKAPNPKFEQVSKEALDRLKKQCDLVVLNRVKPNFKNIEKILNHAVSTPANALDVKDFKFYSTLIKYNKLYDDGCRFEKPFFMDLSNSAVETKYIKKDLSQTLGQSVQADNLNDAIELISSFVFKNGAMIRDQRNILTCENRTLTLTILDPLEQIPQGFSKEYLKKYVLEFLKGKGELDKFEYNYHDRIFKRWGNQVQKIIKLLTSNSNTRRAVISLWDQDKDLGNPNAPCLIFLWFAIRDKTLEVHATYRSHHLATVTQDGKLMQGEGALVPNLYAIANLQKSMSKELKIKRGALVLTDLSGHLYVSEV